MADPRQPWQPRTAGPRWLGLAVQALVVLAEQDRRSSSSALAAHLHFADQATMRRILGQLVRAGLVEAREGREGGYRLTRPPDAITLAEVYRQLAITDPLPGEVLKAFADCPLGQRMRLAFAPILGEIAQAQQAVWARYTIADLCDRLPPTAAVDSGPPST